MVLRVYARTALTLHYSDGAKEICEHYDFERYAFSFTVFYTLKFIRRNTYTCVEYINPRLSTPTLSEIRVFRSCFHFSKWRNKKQLDHIIFPQPCTHQNAQNHEAPLAELGTLRVRFAHPFYPTPRFADNMGGFQKRSFGTQDDKLYIYREREREEGMERCGRKQDGAALERYSRMEMLMV